jgi:hypothetical protein
VFGYVSLKGNDGRRVPWGRVVFFAGVTAFGSCSVYDQSLIEDARGAGGLPGTGGDGSGASGGDGATGGAGGAGGSDGGRGGASGGTAGSTGGSSGGKAGDGGSSGGSGGSSGAGGSKAGAGGAGGTAGKGGAGAGGAAGTVMEGGEGGMPDPDPCPGGDCCPNDPDKTDMGRCGCGVPDTDTDADQVPDCVDGCPGDATRTAVGACEECDYPATDTDCEALQTHLIHRYEFNGTGATATDSVGNADGTLMGMTVPTQSGGVVTLSGGSTLATDMLKQYVQLPTNCLSGLTSATVEVWVNWSMTCTQASCSNLTTWQRIFDFGETSTLTSGANFFLSPRANVTNTPVYAASTTTGANNETTTGHRLTAPVIAAGPRHFAVVIDATASQARLYVDGALASTGAYTGSLASIVATNCWLGRSNYTGDGYFNGTIDEFRIYDAALTTPQVALSFSEGTANQFL